MPSSNALAVDHRARWLKLATTTKSATTTPPRSGALAGGARETSGRVGWSPFSPPKIPTPASLNDVMFDHFRRVVLSDLLTVEGV